MPYPQILGKSWRRKLLDKTILVDLLQMPDLPRIDKLLCCLAVESERPKSVREIREIALESGLREVKKWNVSDYLRKAVPFVANTKDGWRLTMAGQQRVREILESKNLALLPPRDVAVTLRKELEQIPEAITAAFVEEAVKCYEYQLYRASVVLSWAGAVATLYDYVLSDPNRLRAFNNEARRRNAKWRDAITKDDLARMKESDFLDILEAISVIGKNTKQQLKECLRLRNACAHPSTLQIGPHRAAAHLEVLIMNVFSKYV